MDDGRKEARTGQLLAAIGALSFVIYLANSLAIKQFFEILLELAEKYVV